jgi:polar amino acid transport system ATP-binding protein
MDARAQTAAEPIIRMQGVEKWFGTFQVLTDIHLQVKPGERIVVCGPSGSGKSTLIRCINALETVQKGQVVVDGIDLTAGKRNVDKVRAEVGMVFQQFNLFPHDRYMAPPSFEGMSSFKPTHYFNRWKAVLCNQFLKRLRETK